MARSGDVYFADAREFNDPFDCFFIPSSKLSHMDDLELKHYISKKTKFHFPNADTRERRRITSKGIQRVQRSRLGSTEMVDAVMQHQYEKIGICSFVKNNFSIPMWAYYANNHKGMCIGIKTNVIAQHQRKLLERAKLMQLHEIKYESNIPITNIDLESTDITKNEMDEISRTFYTKSDEWDHEGEVRLIFWDHTRKTYSFGSNAVGEVIVGLQATQKNIDRLIAALKEEEARTVVKRARRLYDRYGMDFDTIYEP